MRISRHVVMYFSIVRRRASCALLDKLFAWRITIVLKLFSAPEVSLFLELRLPDLARDLMSSWTMM